MNTGCIIEKKNILEVFFILALFSIQYVLFRKEQ